MAQLPPSSTNGTMRPQHVAISLALSATSTVACIHDVDVEQDVDSVAAALTQEELANAALKNLGAKLPGAEGNCNQCHDINKATLRLWAENYGKAMANLSDTTKSVDQRIAFMRRDPANPRSGFAPA